MDMDSKNPCDICENESKCEECVLHRMYNKAYECCVYECFLNYEGSCLISIYDDCGCLKNYEKGVDK